MNIITILQEKDLKKLFKFGILHSVWLFSESKYQFYKFLQKKVRQ
jgi:hypothetical protein